MKQTPNRLKPVPFAIAACSFEVASGKEVQILPSGKFTPIDGRTLEVESWYIDAEIASKVIAAVSARTNRLVTDYEHQTLHKEKNGQPAPAAGWFKELVWREGQGLFATDFEWTAAAAAKIESKEYRYFSPVFTYDKKTGAVKNLIMGALTNYAGIDGMDEVALAALLTDQEEPDMNIEELLANIRWMLNLPTLATQEEVATELQKAVDKIKASNTTETAAASFSILTLLDTRNDSIAALTAAVDKPDPAKFVPIADLVAVKDQLAALSGSVRDAEVETLISTAIADGKLLAVQEPWARDLGKKDIAALSGYLATATPIAALTGTQTSGKAPEKLEDIVLTDDQVAMCTAMGTDQEEFKKTLLAEATTA